MRRSLTPVRCTNRGFTLIELLVVISIIAVLIALLLPAIKSAKGIAHTTICLSNQRQIGVAVHVYVSDNASYFPVPPIGEYFSTYDIGWYYMGSMIGGDDTGVWAEMIFVPAEVRPLSSYVEPTSKAWRCPADTSPLEWFYGYPAWEAGTSSYFFNASPQFAHPGFYGKRLEDILEPELFTLLGDWAWVATRRDLPSNDLAMFSTDSTTWWHVGGFEFRKVCIAFADGHAAYMPIEIMQPNTNTYRRDP